VEQLVTWLEGQVDTLVADLQATLREADDAFRECDPAALAEGLHTAIWHFALFAHGRDYRHIDQALAALVRVWGPERFFLSIPIRIFFGLEDLVAIRAGSLYHDPEDFLDDLRALHSATRQVLSHFADAVQRRFAPAPVVQPQQVTQALHDGRMDLVFESTELAAQPALRQPNTELGERVGATRFVGRRNELEMVWSRLAALSNPIEAVHQIVGIKGAAGFGKSALIDRFLDRFNRRQAPPHVLRVHAPRLFNLPRWPVVDLIRQALNIPVGVADIEARLAETIIELAPWQDPASPDGQGLARATAALGRFLGVEGGQDPVSPRQVGLNTREALLTLLEALSRRAHEESGGPLFLIIEDADELDGPSWALLHLLLHQLPTSAPVMVLLSYDARFTVNAGVARLPGFMEVVLQPFELGDFELMLDALLRPNGLGEETRLRLSVGAQGSPLLLHEAVRQLIEDGVIGLVDGQWAEVRALPEGLTNDLGIVVARRCQHLSAGAQAVVETLAVIEDTVGGSVLEEMVARHGIASGEVVDALAELERAGLVRVPDGQPITAGRMRHPLVRDEIYRQMPQDRRRSLHEDAGELLARLPGARAFPSLSGSHLALAGWPNRALDALVRGADECLKGNVLDGALELCTQALGLVDALPPTEGGRYRYEALARRERVYARLGRFDLQRQDVEELEALARGVASDSERRSWALRLAGLAVAERDPKDADRRLEAAGEQARGTVDWVRERLTRAIACWQKGQRSEAEVFLRELREIEDELAPPLAARAFHTRGRFAAGSGRMGEALEALFTAWRHYRRLGDPYGEGFVARDLGDLYLTMGRLLDAGRLLRRAESLLRDAEAVDAQGEVLLRLGQLHQLIGDFDEADGYFSRVLRLVDKGRNRATHAAAVVGQGWILVNRGRFDDAMTLLAQCLKDLGRRDQREPVYVDALLALATNFALFARGQKLVVGGLRYAGEAADRAQETGNLMGLIRALVIQVRGLVVLGRLGEARARLGELDATMASALELEPRLERLRPLLELARHATYHAAGDDSAARVAIERARDELLGQMSALEGSGFERGFMSNVFHHREILDAAGA
jgi:tetratricopeptide (TPR) repeat protein